MRRIATGSNRNPAIDLFGPGKHGFKTGNRSLGDPPSTPGGEWFNSIQEELARVVEATGVSLDPAKFDQLLTSIKFIAWGAGKTAAPWAPLSSPVLTDTPTAPTAATGTNTTQVATTAFVNAEIAADRPFEATLANIKMDGAQSVGSLNTVARGDHVHPTDTSRVAKAGDTMSGSLKTRYTGDWVGFIADNPTEGKSTYFEGQVAGIPRGGVQVVPAASGAGEYFTSIRATPPGATNADRRVGGLDVYATGLFANAYGWLHDYFLKRSDCVTNWYASHYGGAQTFKIRNLNLMITTMRVDALGADTTLNLPEAYTGVAHVIGSDAWSGKNVVASCMVSGTQIRVFAGPSTNCIFMIIGFKNNI